MAVEDITTKICTKCGNSKPKTEFSKRASSSDGLRYLCKTCDGIASVKRRAASLDKYRALQRTATAKWQVANPEKHKAAKASWVAANPERVAKINKKWQKANPEAMRINKQNRRAREREACGRLSKGLSDKLFALQRGRCACGCKQPLGSDYHLDHRMPLALGGSNTDDNMQLLRKTCNLQKHAKHPVDFMQQRGFLL